MVEEIRTYLLNSKKYSSSVYIDESFEPIMLSNKFVEFRDVILGADNLTDPKQQIYRANFLVEEIYRHRVLGVVARDMFDTRLIEDTTFINKSFDPQILIDSKNENFVISIIPNAIVEKDVVDQNIEISRSTANNKLITKVNTSFYSFEKESEFLFTENISSFVDIPKSPLRMAFNGVNSVPLNFSKVLLKITYPYFFDINKAIENVQQISGLEFFIFENSTASKNLLSLYNSFTRPHERLLCLTLGLAINLKYK